MPIRPDLGDWGSICLESTPPKKTLSYFKIVLFKMTIEIQFCCFMSTLSDRDALISAAVALYSGFVVPNRIGEHFGVCRQTVQSLVVRMPLGLPPDSLDTFAVRRAAWSSLGGKSTDRFCRTEAERRAALVETIVGASTDSGQTFKTISAV